MPEDSLRPLCVDVDGTLIKGSIFWECVMTLLKRQPLRLLTPPFDWLGSKTRFVKRYRDMAGRTVPILPYREDVLEFLDGERARGRPLILATPCDPAWADAIASHLGAFDEVIARDEDFARLEGDGKRAALEARFGRRGFDYLGHSRADLPAWGSAAVAHVVGGQRLQKDISKTSTLGTTFEPVRMRPLTVVRALRVHQWIKNLLLFVPLVAGHRLFDMALLLQACIGFLAFSLGASSLYVLNDVLDREADRKHPTKMRRPFAAGSLPIWSGLLAIPGILAAGLLTASLLGPRFTAILGVYLACSATYSLFLKQRFVVDVLMLACLYTVRVLAGGIAVGIPVSAWLLAFCVFLFLSLAFVKRFGELRVTFEEMDVPDLYGRAYRAGDTEWLGVAGTSAGYLSVLVLALYSNSEQVLLQYENPEYFWGICLLLLYWITRLWALAYRGRVDEDPLMLTVRDSRSWILAACAALLVVLAT